MLYLLLTGRSFCGRTCCLSRWWRPCFTPSTRPRKTRASSGSAPSKTAKTTVETLPHRNGGLLRTVIPCQRKAFICHPSPPNTCVDGGYRLCADCLLSPVNNVEGGYRNSQRPSIHPKRKSSHSHNYSPILTNLPMFVPYMKAWTYLLVKLLQYLHKCPA